MGDPDQAAERLPRPPPQRLTDPDDIEKQCSGFERHDDEGRERNGDQVGQYAEKPGLVKMVEREWNEGDLDSEPCQEHPQQHPKRGRMPPRPAGTTAAGPSPTNAKR